MKKILLALFTFLILNITQAQINACDSMTVSGTQTQLTFSLNNINSFANWQTFTVDTSILLNQDSSTITHNVYNNNPITNLPYDTLLVGIYYGNVIGAQCWITWIFDSNTGIWLRMINQSQISWCDNFDSYPNGLPIAETSSNWNTWGELMSGTTSPFADDADIVTTMSYSGDNSLYLVDATGQGGPQDIVFLFDTTQNIISTTTLSTPYTSGYFTFSQMMYIVSGKTGYINFQAENIPGIQWALEVNIDANGIITMTNQGGTAVSGTCPIGQWFELSFNIDLSNNIWEALVDGVSQGYFSNAYNQIASLDLYPGINSEYYVDDVCYTYDPNPIILDPVNLAVSNITTISGLTGENINPSVEVINLGSTPITSFDIDFNYAGNTVTENITGLFLSTVGSYQVNFSNSINLYPGTAPCEAIIYNINGLSFDDNPSDDTLTSQATAITPAEGKLVVGEEATGTWCGWCPRGAVALNWMDHDYEEYWQGIAVHNGDPMTNGAYDGAMPVSGYPSGIVDRGPEINPAAFKEDFLQRIVIPPSAIITNGAELNGNNLKVSLEVEFQTSVSGNYKLACVIVEDSVTGSGPDWYQGNAYSGGAAGPLVDVDGTDWANLPGNVPDYQMIYRHVARGISPSFNGSPLSNTSYSLGNKEKQCFEFTLDPSWDQSKIHIVGMLLDNGNMIDNASSTSIEEAVNNLYSACATSSTFIDLNGPDRTNIFPNPATESIYISNLREENTTIKIYDIKGRLVLENKISDKSYLDVSQLSKGIYQLSLEGDNWKETRKLIKK